MPVGLRVPSNDGSEGYIALHIDRRFKLISNIKYFLSLCPIISLRVNKV
jgi:hypothetical protein